MDSEVTRVNDADAPVPLGHYVQATATPQGLVWISAQLPVGDGVTPESPVRAQARQALRNVLAIARRAGCGPEDVLRVTVYVTDVGTWSDVDLEFAEAFGAAKPARAVLGINGLHHGFAIAVDAVAQGKWGNDATSGSPLDPPARG
ncbi:MAG: RidA family protein [Saccharothrix sp.]|nr:RidA family protein [Saccharothrix sp.]